MMLAKSKKKLYFGFEPGKIEYAVWSGYLCKTATNEFETNIKTSFTSWVKIIYAVPYVYVFDKHDDNETINRTLTIKQK